jgi:hypothetical protein
MIGTIRKHSKIMWWIVIVVIILAFVVWDTRTGDGQGGSGNFGTMNGQVITPSVFDDARREVLIYHFFAAGSFPGKGRTIPNFDVERETYNRLLIIQKAAEMGILISDDVAARAASERLRMLNRGEPVPLAAFETQVLAQERLTLADFERFVRNDIAVQQLITTIGGSGQLVPPQEVEALYRRDHQDVSVQVAFFHASNNLASIVVTATNVAEYYTNQQARYRLPERLQLSLVRFPISNYLAQASQEFTNLAEMVESNMLELGTNFAQFGTTPEAAKEKVREELLKRAAFNLAGTAAKNFDNQLYDAANKAPFSPETFTLLATQAKLQPEVTQPFSRNEPPAGLDVTADFVRRAYSLTPDEPLTEPLVGENHIYVIAFNQRLPSEQPSFDSIREKVTSDYRFIEAAMKAQKQAMDFQAVATNGLAAGKSFADLCKSLGVAPVSVTPFSLSTREVAEVENQLDLSYLKRVAFETAPGQVGPVLPSNDGAAVVYVQAKLPIDEAKMRTSLPEFTRSVHQVRRSEVFNAWFQREAEQAFRTLPYFQQKQAQMQSAPGN